MASPTKAFVYIKSITYAPWSNAPGEEEILFAPKSKFQVTKVIARDDAKKMLQVEVSQM